MSNVVAFPKRPVVEVPYASSGDVVVVVVVVCPELLLLLLDPLPALLPEPAAEPLPELLLEPLPELPPEPPPAPPAEPLPDVLPDPPLDPLVPPDELEPEDCELLASGTGRYMTDRMSSSIRRITARANWACSTSACPAEE